MSNHKHNHFGTPIYSAWITMRQRCNNPNAKGYSNYGGRGISYDPRWDDFAVFLADMGARPHGMSIDRIDVNGDYNKANCRWASASVQGQNKRGGYTRARFDEIFRLRSLGLSHRLIALEVGSTKGFISRVLSGKAAQRVV